MIHILSTTVYPAAQDKKKAGNAISYQKQRLGMYGLEALHVVGAKVAQNIIK